MTDQPPDKPPEEPLAPTPPTPPEQAPTDLPATPDSPTIISSHTPSIATPDDSSGVGFAAIRMPDQPGPPPVPLAPPPGPMPLPGPTGYAPGPPQGYVQGPPPGYPPPGYQGPPPGFPPPGYQGPPPGYPPPGYGYAAPPPAPRGGPSVVLVGLLTLVIVLVVGVGALFAFGIGPFARPTPTPVARATTAPTTAPTPVARATTAPTVAPTGAPTTTAGASSGVEPSATPASTETPSAVPSGDVAAALLAHIPPALADTCFVSPSGAPIVAIASCTADDGAIQVTYFQYDNQGSMFQAYEGFRFTSEIEPDTGSCGDPTTWPAENDYNIGGQPAGRLLCTEALGQTSIYWTDDRLNILSQATHTTSDFARLVEFWESESGPNL